jgi:non-specific serine/threonine protein kinase
LRRYRAVAGLTQEELAARAGLSTQAISLLERGERHHPQSHTLHALAEALTLSLSERRALEAAARQQSAQVAVGGAAVVTAPADSRRPPHNLPLSLTSFIGREREMAEVVELLAGTRLLTLTGTGGVGKTRLALQVAGELVGTYPDGVWLVELATLENPALLPQTVAAALGVREEPGQPMRATLVAHLATRRLLLLLDNCEHLIAACAELTQALLRACPELRILATSREGLGAEGERLYRVPSLAVPDLDHLPLSEDLAAHAAVALFLVRAQERRAGFALSVHNAATVVQVCARLDGIPLAIELAAARVGSLPLEAMAARLDDLFRLLSGGPRTALPRQQTLRAALDWSYDLLSEPEQRLLNRLAVFAGGWTLDAAEAVCAGVGDDDPEVLDLLAGLVNKSLVLLDEMDGQQGRYRLLETVRQYAAERLHVSEEEELWVRDRHLAWFLALVELAEPELRGPEQAVWLGRLDAEHDNLRVALRWTVALPPQPGGRSVKERQRRRGDAEQGLRLAAALRGFWEAHGHLSEGREWLERLLAGQGSPDDVNAEHTRAKALNGAGWLALKQGDYERAVALCEESLTLGRELGDKAAIALSLLNLGVVALDQGHYERAMTLNEESLVLGRELGDTWGIAASLANLGTVAMEQGDYGRAAPLLEESAALLREQGDIGGVALVLHNLGYLEREQGHHGRAATWYAESLGLFHELEDSYGIASCLGGLAGVACAQNELQRAVRLGGAAAALREALGTPLPPVDRAIAERDMATARATLGDEAFSVTWAAGTALPLEQAISEALGVEV